MPTNVIDGMFSLRMGALWEAIKKLSRRGVFLRPERQLRLCETLSLGNRGFLAVVRFEEQKFLVGGTNQSLALLAELSRPSHAAGKAPESVQSGSPS